MTPYERKRNWRDLTPEIEHERHLRRVAELELQRYEREQRLNQLRAFTN